MNPHRHRWTVIHEIVHRFPLPNGSPGRQTRIWQVLRCSCGANDGRWQKKKP